MRVVMATIGSRGDVQPLVALGAELRSRGHSVVLATHEPFRDFVEEHGLAFAPLPGDPRAVLETDEAQDLLRRGRGLLGFARRFVGILRPWFSDLVKAVEPLHADPPDIVVYTALAFPAWHLARAGGTPTVLATLQPFQRTSSFAAITVGGRDLGGPINWASHIINEQLFWQPLRGPVNEWRDRLGLQAMAFAGPYRELRRLAEPQVAGFSAGLVPRPADWPERIHVTGAWHLGSDRQLSEPLRAFLDEGPAPVHVGFGSMSDAEATRLGEIALASARRVGRRLVLGAGWAGLSVAEDDRVIVIEDEPHGLLFPRCDVVVHHGGAGTTHTAGRSGRPSVVVPYFGDQPFWARRLEQAGASPAPVPRRRLTVDRLSNALARAQSDDIRAGAKRLGERMRAEPGVVAAAEVIERHSAAGR